MISAKKGAIFHWIVIIGLPIALITFLLAGGAKVQVQPKGTWQLDFLQNNYLKAEQQLLQTSITGKRAGWDVAEELANNGGHLPGINTACGKHDGVNLWNTPQQWCFPLIKENVERSAQQKLSQTMPGNTFSKVGYDNTVFYGVGGEETIVTKYARYTFNDSFSVNIGYSFEEYQQLFQEATTMIQKCGGKGDAFNCVITAKPAHWHFQSCTQENVPEPNSNKMSFCIESPGKYVLQSSPLHYIVALDFQ